VGLEWRQCNFYYASHTTVGVGIHLYSFRSPCLLKIAIFGCIFVSRLPGGRRAIPGKRKASLQSKACDFISYRRLAVSMDVSVWRIRKHGLLSGFACLFHQTDQSSLHSSRLVPKFSPTFNRCPQQWVLLFLRSLRCSGIIKLGTVLGSISAVGFSVRCLMSSATDHIKSKT
jgi:hypothetical protein